MTIDDISMPIRTDGEFMTLVRWLLTQGDLYSVDQMRGCIGFCAIAFLCGLKPARLVTSKRVVRTYERMIASDVSFNELFEPVGLLSHTVEDWKDFLDCYPDGRYFWKVISNGGKGMEFTRLIGGGR
jgi:hypothetical protein